MKVRQFPKKYFMSFGFVYFVVGIIGIVLLIENSMISIPVGFAIAILAFTIAAFLLIFDTKSK